MLSYEKQGGWKIGGAHIGHTCILDIMGAEMPLILLHFEVTENRTVITDKDVYQIQLLVTSSRLQR